MPSPAERLAAGYRADTRVVADGTAAEVGDWWDRTEGAGPFPVIAGAAVAVANRRSVVLALRYLADALTLSLGEPALVDTLNPDAFADSARLRRVLTDVERFRAVRIATDEPLSAGRAALRIAQQRDDRVTGAIRIGGNCPICAPRNGARVPAGADVKSHTGCDCSTMPIVTTRSSQ